MEFESAGDLWGSSIRMWGCGGGRCEGERGVVTFVYVW
jgi:hypothetical protein